MTSYLWQNGTFVRCAAHQGPFDVADSWRLLDTQSNGLNLHIHRFESIAGALPAGFTTALLECCGPGELFPRIGLADGKLVLDVRPAPPARTTTRLTYVNAPDPRLQPFIKGPDFPALAQYRADHQLDGTNDTTIVDSSGAMLETTTGALVAWNGDTLILPTGVALPSITLHQVTARAAELGLATMQQPLIPDIAATHPLWFLNSLHGISPVSELRTATTTIRPPHYLHTEEWQRWWWSGFTDESRHV